MLLIMAPTKFLPFLSAFAVGGAAVPIFLSMLWGHINNTTNHSLTLAIVLEKITLLIWPTALPLLAGAGFDSPSLYRSLFFLAFAGNVIIYSLVGTGLWLGFRKHRGFLVLVVLCVATVWWRLLSLA
jgi:hypothetical protein